MRRGTAVTSVSEKAFKGPVDVWINRTCGKGIGELNEPGSDEIDLRQRRCVLAIVDQWSIAVLIETDVRVIAGEVLEPKLL
jgi:hypothetical protein